MSRNVVRDQVRPRQDVPWSEVGPGWMLAVWNKHKPSYPGYYPNIPRYLFLISPEGTRYLLFEQPNSREAVVGWSGDGRRALLQNYETSQVSQLDLTTGAISDSFRLPRSSSESVWSMRYTSPKGLGLLIDVVLNREQLLRRYSLSGTPQLDYPRAFTAVGGFDGWYLSSPDGTQLVLGASKGIALVSNENGSVHAQYRVPGATECQPTHWWAPGIVLASCGSGQANNPRLYEIHVNTGVVAPLTAWPKTPDYGDLDAWRLASGVYVQDIGACGSEYVAKLGANHRTSPVDVPGYGKFSDIAILGAFNNQLALYPINGCGPGIAAMWFNPATNTVNTVIGAPVTGGSLEGVLLFPDPMG